MIGLPRWLSGKESACSAEDVAGAMDSIPRPVRFPGEGNGNSSSLMWKISWTEEPSGYSLMESRRVRNDLATKQQQEMLYVWWTQNEKTSCNHKPYIFKNHKGLQKANINRKYCTFSDGISETDQQIGRPATPQKDSQSGCLSIISSLLAQTMWARSLNLWVQMRVTKVLRGRPH